MQDNICLVGNVKNSKLLALFGTLEERDKEVIINLAESLVERYKNNISNFICNFNTDK